MFGVVSEKVDARNLHIASFYRGKENQEGVGSREKPVHL
jgi:hypothetical protein